MTYNTGAAARSRLHPMSSDAGQVDRILLAACAVIWLAALGSAVAATVALVGLGSGQAESSSSESGTPWLLYGVIAVSALVIVGAIPLLVRARRVALDDPRAGHGGGIRPTSGRPPAKARAPEPPTQLRTSSHAPAATSRQRSANPPPSRISTFDAALPPAVDRVWLRCAVVIASAMGLALLGIGIATYLMAAGHDTFSWAAYVVAGLVTLAMPAIPWLYLRQLHDLVDS